MVLGDDIAFIVARLKEPPFGGARYASLTGPSLSELGPDATRELCFDAFAAIVPAWGDDARDARGHHGGEDPLLDFLRHAKYAPPPSTDALTMRAGFAAGEHDVVFPALRFVLSDLDRCAKRAYVGHFLADVPVPPEFTRDDDVQELIHQRHELQRQFVEIHKAVDAARATGKDPVKLKQRATQLEREKEAIASRVAVVKGKIASRVDDRSRVAALTRHATSLRAAREEEMELARALREQYEKKDASDAKYQRAAVRLREHRASTASGNPNALIAALSDEVENARALAREKLPEALEKKRARSVAVKEVLASDARADSDLRRATEDVNALQAETRELEESVAVLTKARDADAALRQQAQVAKSVAAKRDATRAKRDKLRARRDRLTSEYETGAVRTEGGDNTGGRTRGAGGGGLDEEMRQKFETVKAKLARYKQLKRELDEVAAEATTLASTEEILRERLSLVSGDVAEEERRAGVTGFAAASETLEEVSRAKASVDERKGEALEEISAFIQEINKKVNERKGKLAPQIKRLREARASHAELEARHAEKKAAYDATAATHRSTYDALEREVNRMKSRMKSDEGRFRLANVEAALVDAHVRRITNGRDAASVKATYVARVEAAEAEAKRLKQRQKEVKDAADGGVDAMEMMKDLHRLMTIKLSAARRLMGETRGSESVTNTGANVLSM